MVNDAEVVKELTVDPPSFDRAASARVHVEALGAYVSRWDRRDRLEGAAAGRQAANEAITEIDIALRQLHMLRARLIGEMSAYDRETAARIDALLAARKESA